MGVGCGLRSEKRLMAGITEQKKFHYSEYCRLAEESRNLYRIWDIAMVSEKTRAPHYAKAAELRRQTDEHKQKFIDLRGT